jgi:hypothetical protein
MTSPAKILLSAVAAALIATPALAKPQKHQAGVSQASVSQASVNHASIADNSTFLTVKTHVSGADFDSTVRLIRDHQPDGHN